MANVLSTKFTIVDDASEKLRKISSASTEARSSLSSISTSTSSLDQISTSADRQSESLQRATKEVENYSNQHREASASVDNHTNSVKSSEDELGRYAEADSRATNAEKGMGEQLKNSQQQYRDTGEEIEKTKEKTEDYEESTESTFSTIENLVATAGLVAFLAKVKSSLEECIEASSEFEVSVAKVSTLAGDEASNKEIGDNLSELSEQTGKLATDLGEAQYQALSAGVAYEKSIDFVDKANKLAVGGFTQQATAVDVLTTAINAYGKSADDAENISDILVTTQNLGKTTVDQLASSMGRVIPSAAAYNVSLEDLATSYAVLTANGLSTRIATTDINAMLNELADTGSDVSTILKEQTGRSFSELESSGGNLGTVLQTLYKYADNDATAFSNLWSSSQAGTGALSIVNSGAEKYNSTLQAMTSSSGEAEKAFEKMENTTEHSAEALSTASTNAQIAVGNALAPMRTQLNQFGTKVLNWITKFASENPSVVRGITAIATAAGVLGVGIGAYTLATKIATIATTAFTAALNSNPIILAATAAAALTAAIASFVFAEQAAEEPTEKLSVATQKQKDKLDSLKSSYNELKEAGKGTSAEASELKYQIDNLTESYEKNKQTVEEFNNEISNTLSSYESTSTSNSNRIEEINSENEATFNLIDRLQELGSQSKLTAADQAELSTIVDILNQKYPELGLTVSKVTGNIKGSIKEISTAAKVDATKNLREATYNALVDEEKKSKGLKAAKKRTQEQVAGDNSAYNYAKAQMEGQQEMVDNLPWWDANKFLLAPWAGGNATYNSAKATVDSYDADEDYQKAKDNADKAAEDYRKNQDNIKKYREQLYQMNAEELGLDTETKDEAQKGVNEAAISIQNDLQNLATAYDNAYSSALDSFQKQYKLWDEVAEVSSTSAGTTTSNIQSQIDYWDKYNSNLSNLQGRASDIKGLNSVLKQLDDGSEKSASILAGMATASDAELKTLVSKYKELGDKQKSTANTTAEIDSNYSSKLKKLKGDVEDTIEGMKLSEEATSAANATMNAYINAIANSQSRIKGAMQTALQGAKDELQVDDSDDGKKGKKGKKSGHATGTTYTEDAFIAGEEGPELIVDHPGATVYTANETRNILNPYNNNAPESPVSSEQITVNKNSTEKVVTLRLEGLGEIKLSGGNSKGVSHDQVVDIISENLKPILIGIVNDEKFEEAEEDYEF